jgi:hypothetical protein
LQAGPLRRVKRPPPGKPRLDPRRRNGRGQKITKRLGQVPRREHARPCNRTTPAKRWPSQVIQLPPLSSPRHGPPQQTRFGPRRDVCEAVAYTPQEEDTAYDHVERPVLRTPTVIDSGLPPGSEKES